MFHRLAVIQNHHGIFQIPFQASVFKARLSFVRFVIQRGTNPQKSHIMASQIGKFFCSHLSSGKVVTGYAGNRRVYNAVNGYKRQILTDNQVIAVSKSDDSIHLVLPDHGDILLFHLRILIRRTQKHAVISFLQFNINFIRQLRQKRIHRIGYHQSYRIRLAGFHPLCIAVNLIPQFINRIFHTLFVYFPYREPIHNLGYGSQSDSGFTRHILHGRYGVLFLHYESSSDSFKFLYLTILYRRIRKRTAVFPCCPFPF